MGIIITVQSNELTGWWDILSRGSQLRGSRSGGCARGRGGGAGSSCLSCNGSTNFIHDSSGDGQSTVIFLAVAELVPLNVVWVHFCPESLQPLKSMILRNTTSSDSRHSDLELCTRSGLAHCICVCYSERKYRY